MNKLYKARDPITPTLNAPIYLDRNNAIAAIVRLIKISHEFIEDLNTLFKQNENQTREKIKIVSLQVYENISR